MWLREISYLGRLFGPLIRPCSTTGQLIFFAGFYVDFVLYLCALMSSLNIFSPLGALVQAEREPSVLFQE